MGERSRGSLNGRGRLSQQSQQQSQSDTQTLSLDPDPDPPDPEDLPLGALQQGSSSSRTSRPGPQSQTPSGTTPYAPITNNMSDGNISSASQQQVIESVHIQSLSPPVSSNSRATPTRISSKKSSLNPASVNNLAAASFNSTRSQHEPSHEFQRQQPLPPQQQPQPPPDPYNQQIQNPSQNFPPPPQDFEFPFPQEEETGAEIQMGQGQGQNARSRSRSRSITRYDNPTNMDMEQEPRPVPVPVPVPIPPPENVNRSRRTSLVVPKKEDGYINYGLLPNAGPEDALLRMGGQVQQPGRYSNNSNNSLALNQNQMRKSQERAPSYAQMGPDQQQQQDVSYAVPVVPVPEMRMRPGMDQEVRLPYNINGNGNLGPRGLFCPYPFSEEHWDPISLQVPCPCPFCPLPQMSGPGPGPGPQLNRMAQGPTTVQPGDCNYGQGLYPLTFNRSYTGEQEAENLNGGGFGLTRQMQNYMQLPQQKQPFEPLDLYHSQNQNNFNLNQDQGQSERFYYDVDPNQSITQQQHHQMSGMYHQQQQQQQQQQYEPFQNQNPMMMMQTPCPGNLCSCPMSCQSQNNNKGGRYCHQPPKQSQPQLCLVDPADPGGAIIPVQIVMADDPSQKTSIQQKMSHPQPMLKKRKRADCLYSLKNSYNNDPERPSSQYPPQNPNPFQFGNLLGGQLNDMNNNNTNNTNNNNGQNQPQMTLIREVFKFQKLPARPPPSSWSSKSVACRPPWTQSFKYSPSKPKFLFLDNNTENRNPTPQLPLCYMCSPSPGSGSGPGGPCNNNKSKGLTPFPFPCSSPIPEYKCRANSDASGSFTCKQMTNDMMDTPCCCCSCCQCKRQRQQQQQRPCKSSRQGQKMGVCVQEKQAQCPDAQCFQSQSPCSCQCPCPCMKRTVVCVKPKVKGDCVIVKKPKLCCGPTSFVREFVLAPPKGQNKIQTDQGCLTNNCIEIEPNTFPDADPCACRCRCCRFQCSSFNCSQNGNNDYNDFNNFNTNPNSINITGMEDSNNLSFNCKDPSFSESNNNKENRNSIIKRNSKSSDTGTGTGKSEKSSSKRNSNASARTGIESNNNNNTGKNGDQDSLESFDVSTTMNANYKAKGSFDSQNNTRNGSGAGPGTENANVINAITPEDSITEIIINPVPDPDPGDPQQMMIPSIEIAQNGSKKSSLSKNSPKQSPKTSMASSSQKEKSPRSSLLQDSLSSKEQIKSIKRKKSSGGGGSSSFNKDDSRGSSSRKTSKSKNN